MTTSSRADEPAPTPLDLGRAAAARLARADWQLDAEPDAAAEDHESPTPAPTISSRVADAPHPVNAPPVRRFGAPQPVDDTPPPSPERIVESLLFVGGPPLTVESAAAAVRGLTAEQFRTAIDTLNRTYRTQNRPYSIQPKEDGYVLGVKPGYATVKERLFGGPREARLSQTSLDVLSLVAYRQPIPKADVDTFRGADSAAVLRQLVRLGLVAVARRGDAGERQVCYGTTPRFLELFGLTSIDDLPRLGDTSPV